MLYKYGKRARDFWGLFFSFHYFEGVFHKTILPLALNCSIEDDYSQHFDGYLPSQL